MVLKKRVTKSIALALVGVTTITPILNTVSAMENNTSSNIISNMKEETIIEDLTQSPYYNNIEYYLGDSDGEERSANLILFSKYGLKALWKTGILQKFMKFAVGSAASAYIGEIAVNGLPKVNPNKVVVGYGYTESGNSVKTAQILLKEHGYTIDADGYYGPKTQSAVKAFQKKYNLDIDGYVGPKTWNALINKVPK